ncbi:hypothetical protein JW859_05685 [bacterium]|nr:hypothetical protein [bacterium]
MIDLSKAAFPLVIICAALVSLIACGGGGSTPEPESQQPADTTAPRITSIDGINNGDVILSSAVFGASATDETGVSNFKLKINGETVVDAALASIVYSWDVRKIESGAYALAFIASDAAGNSTTETVNVTVGDDADLVDAGMPEEASLEIAAQPAAAEDFDLPPMDPALYNPNDSESPRLIISGIRSEDTVFKTVCFSAFASDDTGINVITLLIDGKQVALENKSSLTYAWETTYYADGYHLLTFILRDNGGTVSRCELHMTVDNQTDYYGPEIDPLTESYWTSTNASGQLAVVSETQDYWSCRASGAVQLKVCASDPNQIMSFSMCIDDNWTKNVAGEWLEYTFPVPEDTYAAKHSISFTATDTLGNVSKCKLRIRISYLGYVAGQMRAANGVILDSGTVALIPGTVELGQIDLSTAVATGEVSNKRFCLTEIPCGLYTLYARRGTAEVVMPANVTLTADVKFENDSCLVMPTTYPDTEVNRRAVIVTGTADLVLEQIRYMQNTDTGYYIRHNATFGDVPDATDPIDGDDSLAAGECDFMDFVLDRSRLYQYRYILIEGGNLYEAEWAANPLAVSRLRQWVSDGGQLVLFGSSYDFAEQMCPDFIDFAGSPEIDGLGAVPEALNAAETAGPASEIRLVFNDDPEADYLWPGSYYYWNNLLRYLDRNDLPGIEVSWSSASLISVADYARPVKHWLLAQPVGNAEAEAYPIVSSFSYNLGRIVLFSFPLDQENADNAQLAALIMDRIVFEY